MANRVRVAKDKAELVQSLIATNNPHSPFQTYADVLAFAAAIGAKYHKQVPLESVSTHEPGPVSLDVFISRGYDLTLKLLAIAHTRDLQVLAVLDPEAEERRTAIFEEYANGGLEWLRDELRGAVDYSERLLLILNKERLDPNSQAEFDLSRFL